MFLKLDAMEERSNSFFNVMIKDLNPKIYQTSTDRFVWQDKQTKLTGNVGVPGSHIKVYINGALETEVDALGDGSFTAYVSLKNNENEITVIHS